MEKRKERYGTIIRHAGRCLVLLFLAVLGPACKGETAPPAVEPVPAEPVTAWTFDRLYGGEREGPLWRIRPVPAADLRAAFLEAGAPEVPPKWVLSIHYRAPADAKPGILTWRGSAADVPSGTDTNAAAGAPELFDFYPKNFSGRPLVFQSLRWGALPEEITIEAEGVEILAVRVDVSLKDDPLVPVNADLGTMMYYPRSRWRNAEYELFTFNLYPDILYLISESFTVQSRFLKRLAFFTEKPGFAGTLAKDEAIADLRDWFAHDYRARDLARFFQLAREESFPLNPSELFLRDILVARGIILDDNGRYAEGRGALIALSVESRNRLPVYYVHETVHGLQFTMPEVQNLCNEFFDSLSSPEQDFIRTALVYREYNVLEDRGLLAAEATAYLLQQRPGETDRYFREYIRPWYVLYQERRLRNAGETAEGSYTDAVLGYLAANPGIFGRRGAALEERFQALTGLRAETFYDLLPKDRSL
ncbi:MAG: hypothetical protein LBK77_00150 [Spirochaetaceae bacterium]|jgi:hypothetical protein|nr:hypothetical protein [Spirochaetaceae bacterium]